jgi:dihydroorotate dehydrogenase
MIAATTYYRNKVSHGVYAYVLKPIFFLNDPEFVHDRMTGFGRTLGKTKITQKIVSGLFGFEHPMLEQDVLGIHFRNPIGLSAGFDKNAELTEILPSVGFGFAEIGSITGEPCAGNAKPRLWRLKKSKSLMVYYGLMNDGCEAIAQRLANKTHGIPFGMSIAMTNCIDNLNIKRAVFDYAKAFRVMEKMGEYVTVNISCPNTHGGQPFVEPHKLDYLLDILDEIPTTKPVFVKLSPDMSPRELDTLLDVLKKHRVHGIICTNLTKNRSNKHIKDNFVPEKGGMSGKVVQDMSDRMLAHIFRREGKRFVLVGCGGVFTAEDAYKKIKLGASLVQMITGMIFEGPQVISEINRGLVELLQRDGYTTITQAIGVDNKK